MKDKFGREIDYLRVSVTDNCNLRCIYCMSEKENNFLKKNEKLTDDEIYRVVKESANLGIKKIRITGGEPLVRAGIVKLIGKINEIPGIEEIYLTTNGILLGDKLEELKLNGLKGVNISLDSLEKDKFNKLTRLGNLNNVLEAIDKAIELGVKVKVNTVIVNDINKDEIIDFVNITREKPIDIRFIELMPIGEAVNYKGITNKEVLNIIEKNYSNEILIDDICAELNINKCYFCSMFKKEIGLTFINYLNNYKIEKSKELLKNPNLSLLDISLSVGYNNQSYFSTVFKKTTSKTPLEFREDYLKNKN